ncbi:MAG: ATP-binding protein [Planctomycetota bacterium]|jgi:heavy metal sensor kinase
MNRSIRWTLLLWYALILAVVVGTFGGLLYHHRHRTVYERIDAELKAHALALAESVEWESDEGFDLEQTARYARHLEGGGPDAPWFVVWSGGGRRLAGSDGAPEPPGIPPLGNRDVGTRREIVVPGPHMSRVMVARDTVAARRELAGFLSAILGAGVATLVLSFAGGWLLVGRVLKPIRRMTGSAERISDSNRSERIDIGRTESELGQLAETLNAAFDRLQDAFDRQTRFTADASHELRTPLSVVVANAECALRQDRSPEEYRESLEKCLRAARRMSGVVEGLLVLARSDAGELALDRSDVDLRSVLEETVDLLAPLAEEHEVSVNLDADGIVVPGDAERLRDAVGNLVSNAIRYNRRGGRVDVSLAQRDGRAVLTVADTGVGIPRDALERVFERFFRVDGARSRDIGGSGLGLAITKWIVEAHDGRIALTSQVDVGTTATVRLPVDRPAG